MTLLSAIFVVDELPHFVYVPWREAALSALRFSDELIVIHGGKTDPLGRQPILDYFKQLNDPRIRLFTFPWPIEFEWSQIARSLTYAHLHAQGDWVFRVLVDEIFPDDFEAVRQLLIESPLDINVISVGRYYLLGSQYAYPYREKPLFFRRTSGLGYGMINPAQGIEAMPLLFDDPIDTHRWFDGEQIIKVSSLLDAPDALDRLQAGATPRGFRDMSRAGLYYFNKAFLNTDVNFLPDELILEQKWTSAEGYARLPEPYRRPLPDSPEILLESFYQKIKQMLDSQQLMPVKVPESLLTFIDAQKETKNQVRRLVEVDYHLPWHDSIRQHQSVKNLFKRFLAF